mgnify:CR=1 FL=1
MNPCGAIAGLRCAQPILRSGRPVSHRLFSRDRQRHAEDIDVLGHEQAVRVPIHEGRPFGELLMRPQRGRDRRAGHDELRARLVANPGCYVTASLLALLPLLSAGAIDPATIVVDAKVALNAYLEALEAVMAGKPPPAIQKASLGCNIKWKLGNAPDYFR